MSKLSDPELALGEVEAIAAEAAAQSIETRELVDLAILQARELGIPDIEILKTLSMASEQDPIEFDVPQRAKRAKEAQG
jgi:hypothetical protein